MRNIASIDNYGFNAAYEGTAAHGALQYGVNLTTALAFQDAAERQPLPLSPRAFGNARVAYDLPGALPTVALAASFESVRPFEYAFTPCYENLPYSSPQLIPHLTVSGPIPWVRGLSYRVSGYYASTDREPYHFGPQIAPSPQTPTPSYVPIDRARALVGLTYEL